MPRFTDTRKRDPYRNFNFRIVIANEVVAACKKMSKLAGSVEVVKFRAGTDPWTTPTLLPGRASYEPVTLENGLTDDKAFQQWATILIRNELTKDAPLTDPLFRKTVEIHVFDIDNKTLVRKYVLNRAWVSKYTALSDLSADANEVIIESIQIEHEGFHHEEVQQ